MPRKDAAFGTICIALVLACGDNTGPGIRPHAIEIVSGDGQGALPGEAAPEPLRVRVTAEDGRPVAEATIRWSVTSGEATLTPAQNTTNADGEAETRVSLGETTSGVEVQATTSSLPPATFSVFVLDPCLPSSARPLSLEITVTGMLRQVDCDLGDGRLRDFHAFTLGTQQAFTARLRAPTFDPFFSVFARAPNGAYFERGGTIDTVNATRSAVSTWILPAGEYEATASSWDVGMTGEYDLLLSAASGAAERCEAVFVMRGVTTEQRLTTTDCIDNPGPFHRDVFFIILWIGERVTLTQSSAEFAPRLRLLRRLGALIAEADGSATGTAAINFTSDETSLYIVHATSAVAGRSGAYTLAAINPVAGVSASNTRATPSVPQWAAFLNDPLHR
jgi:hypothetical protein